MARPVTVNFKRMTFSFPGDFVDEFRIAFKRLDHEDSMSDFVRTAVENELERRIGNGDKSFLAFKRVNAMRAELTSELVDKRPSVEILREIRYNGKH